MDFTRLERHLIEQSFTEDVASKIMAGAIDRDHSDLRESEWGQELFKSPTSVGISALFMLAHAFKDEETFTRIRLPGTLAVLRVESSEWVAPVAKAFEIAVRPFGKVSTDLRFGLHHAWSNKVSQVVVATRQAQSGSWHHSEDASDNSRSIPDNTLMDALGLRLPIMVVCSADQSPLSPTFASAIDFDLSISAPSALIVQKLMHIFCEAGRHPRLPELKDVLPAHIAVAFRMAVAKTRSLQILQSLNSATTLENAPPAAERIPQSLPGLKPVQQWAEDLRLDVHAFRAGEMGLSDLPRGVIVEGPPGVGKTRSAAAVAEHVGIPIVHASVGSWIGQGAGHLGTFCRAMRLSFREAKTVAPSLLVIDEIDAFPTRGTDTQNFWDAAVAALLESLDGSADRDGVVVMALCNDASRLDPALGRSGRFDETITVSLPKVSELAEIYTAVIGKDLPGVDFLSFAASSAGATIADIDRIAKQARRKARREGRGLALADIEAAIINEARPDHHENRVRSALHEAGHVLIGHIEDITVEGVTLAGAAFGNGKLGWVDTKVSNFVGTMEDIRGYARMLLGGRAAEILVLGSPSVGAGIDLKHATQLFTKALGEEGLGSKLFWRPTEVAGRPWLFSEIADEVEAALRECHAEATTILKDNVVILHQLKNALLERGHLSADDISQFVSPKATLRSAGRQ